MSAHLPRILYLLAFIAWMLLLWPNPVTIFLAGCFSCLTLPLYRRLRVRSGIWRRRLEMANPPEKTKRFLLKLATLMPITAYILAILLCLLTPVAVLALLVSPQAMAGLNRLRELRESNFQLPPNWVEYIQHIRNLIHEYPRFEKIINDTITNLDAMFSDAVGMLVSRSFGFVGSTMNFFWLAFLFITVTILFTAHARHIRKIACRLLNVPLGMVARYILAIHRALKAIMLGIVLVALVQGTLCGIGFAVAGVNQPAFWGLLATLVAPIPFVGTALVWGPLCLSLWFTGSTMAALGLALWGTLFVAGVDNVLRPFFLRQGIKASFFVLILAILCGLSSFGAVGLIAGPILLAIAMQSIDEANNCYKGSF